MSTRSRILDLKKKGYGRARIASELGVSRAWVNRVLRESKGAGQPERPLRPPRQLGGKKKRAWFMDRETFPRAIQVLLTRSDWSWNEADREFEAHQLDVRGDWVYKVLHRAGFVYDKHRKRWVRSEP